MIYAIVILVGLILAANEGDWFPWVKLLGTALALGSASLYRKRMKYYRYGKRTLVP